MEKRISKVKEEGFAYLFYDRCHRVFLSRNERWLRITFRGLSNPRKEETRSISFFYRGTDERSDG